MALKIGHFIISKNDLNPMEFWYISRCYSEKGKSNDLIFILKIGMFELKTMVMWVSSYFKFGGIKDQYTPYLDTSLRISFTLNEQKL